MISEGETGGHRPRHGKLRNAKVNEKCKETVKCESPQAREIPVILVSECLSVWASVCLSVWVSECQSVWASEWLGNWATENLSIWVSECLSNWVSERLSDWAPECLSVRVSELGIGRDNPQVFYQWAVPLPSLRGKGSQGYQEASKAVRHCDWQCEQAISLKSVRNIGYEEGRYSRLHWMENYLLPVTIFKYTQ